jgi:putative effector of murein hydrolase LrgA (UPF0299 family)
MIDALILLFICQLAGEFAARLLTLPVPGPVIGLAFLLLACAIHRPLADRVEPVSRPILANLSLLFVPVGVGIVQQLDLVRAYGVALAAAVLVSTVLTLAVTVLTFVGVSRLTGGDRP